MTSINNIQWVKLQKRTKVNTEAVYMLCPWSFIVISMHTALGLYLRDLYWEGYLSFFKGGITFRGTHIRDFTFHVLFVEHYVCSLTRGVVLECFLHN